MLGVKKHQLCPAGVYFKVLYCTGIHRAYLGHIIQTVENVLSCFFRLNPRLGFMVIWCLLEKAKPGKTASLSHHLLVTTSQVLELLLCPTVFSSPCREGDLGSSQSVLSLSIHTTSYLLPTLIQLPKILKRAGKQHPHASTAFCQLKVRFHCGRPEPFLTCFKILFYLTIPYAYSS